MWVSTSPLTLNPMDAMAVQSEVASRPSARPDPKRRARGEAVEVLVGMQQRGTGTHAGSGRSDSRGSYGWSRQRVAPRDTAPPRARNRQDPQGEGSGRRGDDAPPAPPPDPTGSPCSTSVRMTSVSAMGSPDSMSSTQRWACGAGVSFRTSIQTLVSTTITTGHDDFQPGHRPNGPSRAAQARRSDDAERRVHAAPDSRYRASSASRPGAGPRARRRRRCQCWSAYTLIYTNRCVYELLLPNDEPLSPVE